MRGNDIGFVFWNIYGVSMTIKLKDLLLIKTLNSKGIFQIIIVRSQNNDK